LQHPVVPDGTTDYGGKSFFFDPNLRLRLQLSQCCRSMGLPGGYGSVAGRKTAGGGSAAKRAGSTAVRC